MSNHILTTSKRYEYKTNEIIEHPNNPLKEFQKVVAIGPMVRDIKVGDLVNINPSRYAAKLRKDDSLAADIAGNRTLSYNFDMLTVNGEELLQLYDSDINYVVEEYQEVEEKALDTTGIVTPNSSIVQ